MFFLEFLKQSVPADEVVTREFIELMVPQLLEKYVDRSAKGGTHQDDDTLEEKTKRDFEALGDQSMFSHLLNGIFPSLRLMHVLEDLEDEDIEKFSDLERRVYILSYLMHDIDKIKRRPVETITREVIEESKAFIAEELRECNAEAFFPQAMEYLEDITFLVVNTQRTWKTHLVIPPWKLRLLDRIANLRDLCTFSDQIAYLVTSPAEILHLGGLRDLLESLSEHKLTFHYHQLRDVRGLFTSVVNNGLINLFTNENKREGIWPYLFFSDGVVYLARKTVKLSITNEQVVEAVKNQLQQVCGVRVKGDAPGFAFSNQGNAKHPEYYFEFLSLDDYLQLLINSTMRRTVRDITAGPFEKLKEMQANGEIAADLLVGLDLEPDLRASRLARFLSVIFTTVLGMLTKNQQELYKRIEQEIANFLELQPYWEQSKAIPNKGGLDYRWFWLAARYMQDHKDKGIDFYNDSDSLEAIFQGCFALIKEHASTELAQAIQERQRYLTHLPHYLETTVELPHTVRNRGILPDFHGEMEGYTNAKGKGKAKKLICTLCNSSYPTEAQSDNAVLFQPWVYKNKMPLYAGTNAGGVCAICALELMLRQLLQKGDLRLTGTKFEAMKSKYIAVYPNYFFTAETGAMVQGIIGQLWDMSFFTLCQQLTGQDLRVKHVINSQMFRLDAKPESKGPRTLPESYDQEDNDSATLEDLLTGTNLESAPEQGKEPHEYRYIKYQYPEGTYPSMCFFGMPAGKDDNDTASWAMPALLALALPLVTGAKVVISELLLPLFASGHDFPETVVFDAPHPYLGRLLDNVWRGEATAEHTDRGHRNRVRVNKVLDKLSMLVQVYQVNFETYSKKGKPEWQHLSAVVRDIETDPMYVFSYLREQERRGTTVFASRANAYIGIYQRVCRELLGQRICQKMLDMNLLEEKNLGNIQKCVELYTTFYRGGYEAYSILKPIDTVAKAIINSPLEIDEEDLLWQIQGEIRNWLDRVRSRQATGYAVFWGKDIDAKEAPAIRDFITYFYKQVFSIYCQGERGVLRSRINRFKDGCEAYYVHLRTIQRIQEQEAEKEPIA